MKDGAAPPPPKGQEVDQHGHHRRSGANTSGMAARLAVSLTGCFLHRVHQVPHFPGSTMAPH